MSWLPLTLVLALTVAGCAREPAAAGSPPAPAPTIAPTASSARQAVAAGAVLVDVRTPDEFGDGHLPGAVNIPVDELAARAGELPPGGDLVVYCRSGRRSSRASALLRERGHRVIDLGPMSAW